VFSMASILNMEYMDRQKKGKQPVREEIIDCGIAIRNNKVVSFLSNNGYEIVNYSTFDLANHPARVKQEFIPVSTRLIMEETLLYRLCDEFSWFFNLYPRLSSLLPVPSREEGAYESQKAIQLTIDESSRKTEKPKFVYGHFLIPHWPYLYDAKGNRQPEIFQPKGNRMQDTAVAYLNYLEYGNMQIRKLVDSIQTNTGNKAVIVLMSDHGFRGTDDPGYQFIRFHNLNALFLPDKQYQQWNDSVTSVNQFRILFNTLFRQQYKMLNDSFITIFEEPKGIEGF
ncbi:MAG: sulfatase-like hydrolase/transferase, partial [Pseudobacter sp.]|uniref:sulfatase-like hydrolase/transferase n=1 Tax=Pseudobacter sp. TaxID=2045420 RepID=UPI003F7F47CB